jgi:NADH dehydrogenase
MPGLSRNRSSEGRDAEPHRVVVVGGGFGGLQAVRGLRRAPVEVTLVDRRNFHLFQPLLYQVATGALAAEEIATPLRVLLQRQRNVRVLMGEVTGIDADRRQVTLEPGPRGDPGAVLPYDTLVVAGGSRYSYFGHEEWQPLALEIKSVESALRVRRRIFTAFEAAEIEPEPERRAPWLTFVIVGGGATGVEMAGQIAELARDTLPRDARAVDSRSARILVVEASERILPSFPPHLSARAEKALARLGVTVLLNTAIVSIDEASVHHRNADGETVRVATRTVIWAAGVAGCEVSGLLAAATGAALDGADRIAVGPDLTVPGHPEVIALGDMASVHDAAGTALGLPGLASTAMQQGRYAAGMIRRRTQGEPAPPFVFRDKGSLATIGRARAVADIHGVAISGIAAWLIWLNVHIFYLAGLQNRLLVLTRWTFSFVTRGRNARLITGDPATATEAMRDTVSPPTTERADADRIAIDGPRTTPAAALDNPRLRRNPR